MNAYIKSSPLLTLLLAANVLGASDQYMWLDDKGVKQLSDRSPPPSVSARRILKTPDKRQLHPNVQPQAPSTERATDAVPTSDTRNTALPTLAERNAAFNQRRAEAAAADQKSAASAQERAAASANCDAARQNQRTLDQGIRIASVDKTGEPAIMSDQERADFGKKNQKVLAGCQ